MGRKFEVRKASMAKTQGAKTKLYSRYGKEVYMAAKGNPNPETNIALKRKIEEAKSKQVTKDVIDRAIKKAAGGSGEDYQSIRYEGYGPGGCTVMIDCLTDNLNRTVSEVRNCFTKTNCKMGVSGCVSHSYSHHSLVSFKGMNEEEALETLIMADCEPLEIEESEDGIEITSDSKEHYKVVDAIKEALPEVEFTMAEQVWEPMDYVTIEDEEAQKMFDKFISMLDECDDVQEVHHNVEE